LLALLTTPSGLLFHYFFNTTHTHTHTLSGSSHYKSCKRALFWPTTPTTTRPSPPTATPPMPPQLLSGALYTRLVAVWELEKWQALGYLAGKKGNSEAAGGGDGSGNGLMGQRGRRLLLRLQISVCMCVRLSLSVSVSGCVCVSVHLFRW